MQFSFTDGYAHGTGDHLRHIVCIVCLDRFSRKKTRLDRLNDRSFGSFFKNDRDHFKQ